MFELNDFNSNALKQNLLQDNLKNPGGYERDTRFWQPTKNDDGTVDAVIRLMVDPNKTQFVELFKYSLQKWDPVKSKKAWFVEYSSEIIGLPTPMQEHYATLKSVGTKEADKEADNFKRGRRYFANVLVVADPKAPDNNGKVMLYEFGPKLLKKFQSWMYPSDSELNMGQQPKELYSPFAPGVNIKLTGRKNEGNILQWDDTSLIVDPANPMYNAPFQLPEGDKTSATYAQLPEVQSTLGRVSEFVKTNCHDLGEFVKPEWFKTYEEYKAKFDRFLAIGRAPATAAATATAQTAQAQPAAQPAPQPAAQSLESAIVNQTAPAAQAAPVQTAQPAQHVQPAQVETTSAPAAQTAPAAPADNWLDSL